MLQHFATEFEQPIQADDVALTNALRNMAISDRGTPESWESVDHCTEASDNTQQSWSLLLKQDYPPAAHRPLPGGPGASGPATPG